MKRIFFLIIALCAMSFAQAQVGVVRSSGAFAVQKSQDLGPLTRDGKIYYYHDQPMTEAEMVTFIQKDCARAYNHYKRWKKIEIAGWSLLGAGVGMVVIGSGLLGGANLHHNEKTGDAYAASALAFYGAAGITGLVGISLGPAGNVKKKNTNKVYNTWCGYKELETSQLELKLTPGANGLGLALSF